MNSDQESNPKGVFGGPQDTNKNGTAGRPSIYCHVVPRLPKAIELFRKGGSIVEVCCVLGLSKETFYKWLKDDEKQEFIDAIKEGLLLSEAWWMSQGRENLENKDFSAVLFYMNMKNRFGWRDKHDVAVDGSINVTIDQDDAKL